MTNAQNTPTAKEATIELVGEGLLLGGKTGLIVSLLYSVVVVIELVGPGLGFSYLPSEFGFWGKVVVTILGLIVIVSFTTVPATIIGAVTGMYFGQLTKFLGERSRMTRYLFLVVCVSSCLVVVMLFHILFRGPIANSFQSQSSIFSEGVYGTYPVLIGIPSVIYVLVGSWVGWRLYSRLGIREDGLA
jgi:hypothetical protein